MNTDVFDRIAARMTQAGLEKEAGIGSAIGKGLGLIPKALGFRGSPGHIDLGLPAPHTVMSRTWNNWSPRVPAALGAGAAGVGLAASGDSSRNIGRTLFSPTTWAGREDPQAHAAAHSNWQRLNTQAQGEIDNAFARGDHEGAQRLMSQVESGGYRGGRTGTMWGLNPWGSRTMGDYRGEIQRVRSADQVRADRISQRMQQQGLNQHADSGAWDTAVNNAPADRRGELGVLRDRFNTYSPQLKAIQERMGEADTVPGINGRRPGVNAAGGPAGHWNMGSRPMNPGQVAFPYLGQYDFRRQSEQPDNEWNRITGMSQQPGGGGLTRPY